MNAGTGTPPLVKLEGKVLELEIILDPPKHLPLPLPVQQASFVKIVANRRGMADGSPSVLIVIPLPPLGGTVVAQIGLRSFLDAAALLEGTFGRPGGISIAPAQPAPFDYKGPLQP